MVVELEVPTIGTHTLYNNLLEVFLLPLKIGSCRSPREDPLLGTGESVIGDWM
jgi:hypothetical protein